MKVQVVSSSGQLQQIIRALYTSQVKFRPTTSATTALSDQHVRSSEFQNHVCEAKPFSEIPTAKSLPVLGFIQRVRNRKHLHLVSQNRHRQFGPIYNETHGSCRTVFLDDLDEFQNVIKNDLTLPYKSGVGSEDNIDKNQIVTYIPDENLQGGIDNNVIHQQLSKWHEISQRNGGTIPNLEVAINELSLGMLASSLMGKTYNNRYVARLEKDAAKYSDLIKERLRAELAMEIIPAALAKKWGLRTWQRYCRARNELKRIGNKWALLVKNDLNSPGQDGLIHMFLKERRAKTETEFNIVAGIVSDLIMNCEMESVMKIWLLYAMGQNPLAQDKVVEELNSICGKGQVFSSPQLEDAVYLRACVNEAMRLYPATVFSRRITSKVCVISGYQIPPQTVIAMNIYACSRNPKYFPNPDVFWPERWHSNSNQFGGSHPFIDFALSNERSIFPKATLTRISLFLGRLLQEFHLRCDRIQPTMRILLVPGQNMNLRIAKRP